MATITRTCTPSTDLLGKDREVECAATVLISHTMLHVNHWLDVQRSVPPILHEAQPASASAASIGAHGCRGLGICDASSLGLPVVANVLIAIGPEKTCRLCTLYPARTANTYVACLRAPAISCHIQASHLVVTLNM